MSLWTHTDHRAPSDGVEDLAYGPSGGRAKQWFSGVVFATVPIVYGGVCIERGHTTLFGNSGSSDFTGKAGFWLAVAYIAIGAFLHFHYFWGLSERLCRFSQVAKVLSLFIFLPSFFCALYHFFF